MEDNKEIKSEVKEEPKVESKVESQSALPNLDELFVKNNTELKEWVINLFTNMQKSNDKKEPEVPKKKELSDF